MTFISSSHIALICAGLLLSAGAVAQTPPQPLPMPAEIAAPRDVPYIGVLRLDVDATDTARHIFNVRETIPVAGGTRTTLLYPRWLPGSHSPSACVEALAGLIIRAGGARLELGMGTQRLGMEHPAEARAAARIKKLCDRCG